MSDSNITKNALAASMKKLMAQRPFEKISVSDICSDCGINRKSFYYHFRDKYDLVNWIFYVGFIGEMDLRSYENGWDWLTDICEYFYREKKFYRCALKIEGQNSFRDYLVETAWPIAEFFMKDLLPQGDDEDFYLTFIIDALINSIIRWLSGGYYKEMDAKEYMSKVRGIVTAFVEHPEALGKEEKQINETKE